MEIPIVDNKGKELGKFLLNDEVEEVLKTTGLDFHVIYFAKQNEAIGYLI
jgi:hypothetical protein